MGRLRRRPSEVTVVNIAIRVPLMNFRSLRTLRSMGASPSAFFAILSPPRAAGRLGPQLPGSASNWVREIRVPCQREAGSARLEGDLEVGGALAAPALAMRAVVVDEGGLHGPLASRPAQDGHGEHDGEGRVDVLVRRGAEVGPRAGFLGQQLLAGVELEPGGGDGVDA